MEIPSRNGVQDDNGAGMTVQGGMTVRLKIRDKVSVELFVTVLVFGSGI